MDRLAVSLLLLAVTTLGTPSTLAEASSEIPASKTQIETKQLTVQSQDLLLNDIKRGKTLPIKVSFPQEVGKYPVIVFSHGARGSKNNYQPLIRYWVSHGFVCIQPTHSESLTLMREGGSPARGSIQTSDSTGSTGRMNGQLRARLRERLTGSALGRDRSAKDLLGDRPFQDWHNRPLDVSFVLDSLQYLEGTVEGLKGKMDMSAIGVGGHSFGAHTSQLLGGTKAGGTGRFEDKRPAAFLLISPQGREDGIGGALLDDNSWSTFTRPMMVITGTNDTGRGEQSYEWRKDPYYLSPKGDKYLLVIDGAYHHFGGISGVRRAHMKGPEDPNQVELVAKTSLLFWDSYLKKNDTEKKALKSHALPENKSIKYKFSAK